MSFIVTEIEWVLFDRFNKQNPVDCTINDIHILANFSNMWNTVKDGSKETQGVRIPTFYQSHISSDKNICRRLEDPRLCEKNEKNIIQFGENDS